MSQVSSLADQVEAKKMLMERLKMLKIKGELKQDGQNPLITFSNNEQGLFSCSISQGSERSYINRQNRDETSGMPISQHNGSSYVCQNEMMEAQDIQQQEKQEKLNPQVKVKQKSRRPYYEHYQKQGIWEPFLQYVRNHPNPSGKPSNIAKELTENIQIIRKRPWVYFGPENVPSSDCQQINEKNFSLIFEKARQQKRNRTGSMKRSNSKKNAKKQEDNMSEISQQFDSNYLISDSLSQSVDLISDFRTQRRITKFQQSDNMSESQCEDDLNSVTGSVTQRHRYNLFDSSDSGQSESSKMSQSVNTKSKEKQKRFKKILYDEEDSDQNSNQNKSSMNISISKSSSLKVQHDDQQSQMSLSKSKSKNRPKGKAKTKAKNVSARGEGGGSKKRTIISQQLKQQQESESQN